ncbi:ABC transporter substrate-binding protein [Lewinella sp. IMCC34191]|uniref:ABC transporter substrate-binding protein n=1 Tax=Lewinella sp. IMCC34191 TaxID=2259172 RepID=UPI0018E53408|nr:ABC transporter substrate-binding protein [Lewinella sp. IMCC34191]
MNLRLLVLSALVGMMLCCAGETTPTGEFPDSRNSEEVRIVLKSEPPTLNPLLTLQSVTRYVAEHIFQTLNRHNPETYELDPALASVPTVTSLPDGGLAYDYRIDSLARWPNGSRVTAGDVIFSLKALLNPLVGAGPYRSYYSMISDVVMTGTDSMAFRVLTKRPYVLSAEAIGDLYVFPRYAYDPEGLLDDVAVKELTDAENAERLSETNDGMRRFADDFNSPERGYKPDKIVGSGPYELKSWEDGQRIRLRLRQDYWAKERREEYLKAVPQALTFEIISDNTTTANALRDQLVDMVVDMPIDQFLMLRDEAYLKPIYDFVSIPSFKYYSILLNQNEPILNDSLTRRALAHTVDVDLLIKKFFPDLAQRITGPVLPSKDYYNRELTPLSFDLDQARKLLTEAGWSDTDGDGILDRRLNGDKQELSFTLLTYANPVSEGVCLYIAQTAAEVGVDISVVRQEGRTLIDRLNAGNFVASFYGLGFDPTPDDFSQGWYSTAIPPSGTNRGHFSNSEADSLIRRIAATTDSVARAPLYQRFQEIVYENQPMIFLYSPNATLVVSKRLDYSLTPLAPNLYFNAIRVRPTS